jgi:hypothetical protein
VCRVSDDGRSRGCGEALWPSSESLQRRNPREVDGGAGERVMGISGRGRGTWSVLTWRAE